MRKGCTLIVNKFDLNTANDEASAKASPFYALIVLGKTDCPYCLNFTCAKPLIIL